MNDIENVVLPNPAEVAAPVPEVKTPTPEEIAAEKAAADKLAREAAAKALADKIAARIAELKTFEGKTFKRNDGKERPIKVLSYGGTRIHQEFKNGKPFSIESHVFKVESHDGRTWTPPATQFLNEHTEVEIQKDENTNEPI